MEKSFTKRKQQAMDTKEKIYSICIEMMLKKGYDQINITDICKKAGISVGGFYHHFKSKEDIIIEAYKQADEQVSSVIESNILTGNSFDKIRQVFRLQMEGATSSGVKLLTQLYKSQINEGNNFLFSKDRVLPRVLSEIVKEGQQNNEITEIYDVDFIVKELLRFSRSIMYDWCAHAGEFNIIEEMDTSLGIFLKGIAK